MGKLLYFVICILLKMFVFTLIEFYLPISS